MSENKNKFLFRFSIFFYTVCAALSVYGTFFDLDINKALFSPQNSFAIGFEAFAQCSLWFIWGPLFSVLFLTRHSLKDYTVIFSRFLPFIKPIENTSSKAYSRLDKTVNVFTATLFFVLCVIGWKKPVSNILKHMFDINDIVYIIISVLLSVLSILLFSRLEKKTLRKLEVLAASGLLLGLALRLTEKIKPLTHRIRFREMVAYSNNILDDNGMSHGTYTKLSPVLEKGMAKNADFSAFTKWFLRGDDMGIYAKADSFPSGHVMNSCAIFLSYNFCCFFEKLKKYSPFMMFFSCAYISAMALSRIIAGAHYLTDVSFAMIIGYSVFLISYAFMKKMKSSLNIER